MNKRWLVRRKFRSGHTDAFVGLDLAPGLITRCRLIATGTLWVAAGLPFYALGFLIGEHWRLRALRGIAYGLGVIRGSLGGIFVEYPR